MSVKTRKKIEDNKVRNRTNIHTYWSSAEGKLLTNDPNFKFREYCAECGNADCPRCRRFSRIQREKHTNNNKFL